MMYCIDASLRIVSLYGTAPPISILNAFPLTASIVSNQDVSNPPREKKDQERREKRQAAFMSASAMKRGTVGAKTTSSHSLFIRPS
jgi:hypothetical protein